MGSLTKTSKLRMQVFVILILFITSVFARPSEDHVKIDLQKVQLIIDTDASFAVDDVVAICLAHSLANKGEVDIRAIVHNTGIPEAIGAVSVLNHYFGRDDILLGSYKGTVGMDVNGTWIRGDYIDELVNNWDSPIKDNSQVMEATEVYRKVLSEAEDHSIVISSIGFVQNIAHLLQSEPDQYSPLNGYDLIMKKVKTIVWQGGHYPPINQFGWSSFNWDCGARYGYQTEGCMGASEIAVNNMPPNVEMIYSDMGSDIITGGKLSECTEERNPCRAAIEMSEYGGFGEGTSSWDAIVTLKAIRPDDFSDYVTLTGEGKGRNRVDYNGVNTWKAGDYSEQQYMVLNGAWDSNWDEVEEARKGLGEVIDNLLCSAFD